jgi:hypothetical protein
LIKAHPPWAWVHQVWPLAPAKGEEGPCTSPLYTLLGGSVTLDPVAAAQGCLGVGLGDGEVLAVFRDKLRVYDFTV